MVIKVKRGSKTRIYLRDKEYRAFEIAKLGKDLRLSPKDTLNEMKKDNLSGADMRAGLDAFFKTQGGGDIKVKKGKPNYPFKQRIF